MCHTTLTLRLVYTYIHENLKFKASKATHLRKLLFSEIDLSRMRFKATTHSFLDKSLPPII